MPGGYCVLPLSHVYETCCCQLITDVIHKYVRDKYTGRFPELDSLVHTPLEYIKTVQVHLYIHSKTVQVHFYINFIHSVCTCMYTSTCMCRY